MTVSRLLAVLCALAAAVALWQLSHGAGEEAAEVAGEIVAPIADARFAVAGANLTAQLRATGSYAGTVLPAGLTLVRADASGFCVQAVSANGPVHLAGPGQVPAAGAC